MAAASRGIALHADDDSAPLPTRELGKTAVKVPILGVGTAPAGHRSRKEAAELYSYCLDVGANFMDTAPSFAGYGVAQAALGDVLKTRRDEAFVVTKCWEPDGENALKLLKSNLDELQTDRADLVYAHSIGSDKMDPKQVLGPDGVMRALLKAQKDGLTRFIGISGHNRPQRFLEVLKEYEIQVMMNAVSYVSRHIYNFEETVWPEASRRGVALVAMKVYGGGVKRAGGRVKSPDVFDAFRYAQSLPNISTVVIGLHGREELDENVRFARTYKTLSKQEMADLLDRGKQLAESWGTPYGPVA
jgi:aryl-alcohol dehydrogenase-like predicted oxidoreductase